MDYYFILGLKKDASQEEIKLAYKKLAKKFHPDKNDGDKFFEDKFKEVQNAYEILSDSLKKSKYDRSINNPDSRKTERSNNKESKYQEQNKTKQERQNKTRQESQNKTKQESQTETKEESQKKQQTEHKQSKDNERNEGDKSKKEKPESKSKLTYVVGVILSLVVLYFVDVTISNENSINSTSSERESEINYYPTNKDDYKADDKTSYSKELNNENVVIPPIEKKISVASLIGTWAIDYENLKYIFYRNKTGEYINSRGNISTFRWSLVDNNLRVVLDSNSVVWDWRINSFTGNNIKMYSRKNNLNRSITKL